jgi:hypothetical protein
MNALFGSHSANRVLLCLYQQQQGHAAHIARTLGLALSVVQKQLIKFESDHILEFKRVGKNKVYSWNKNFPAYKELQTLLKKIFQDRQAKIEQQTKDPSDGSHLSLKDRLKAAEVLYQDATRLNPYSRYKAFIKTFKKIGDYENWRKKQSNPWLT